jgi:hypothetical protein
MARLEVSEHVCSADLCHYVLKLMLLLEQLADLFFAVACHLVQLADDVARKWHGAVCIEVQEVHEKLLSRLEVLREECHCVCRLAQLACMCRWVVQVIGPLEQQGLTECQNSIQHRG